MIERRKFIQSMAMLAVGTGTGFLSMRQAAAIAPADTRIRVLDADFDVRPYLDQMQEEGITVIGRYYSREIHANCNYEGKMLTRAEADEILKRGMGLLTVFQVCNGAGGFKDAGKGKTDGQWAVKRADEIGQPKDTAIYFGVDFNPMPEDEDCAAATMALANIQRYFEAIRDQVAGKGWRVGVYGPGKACAKLKEWGLADYFWLSASIGYWGQADFYNSGQWHLFQNKTDLPIYSAEKSRRIDTNITNSWKADFGQWRRTGMPPQVDEATALAVIEARRFLKTDIVYLERDPVTGELKNPQKVNTILDRVGGRSCTLVKTFEKRVAGINLQESTGIDAYCQLENLTASLAKMPVIRNWPTCET